ncbi:MAG: 23S rRNA (pseudouridine(1915)-N(3))-methyltransferase RlmH [Trueperaceae bacterium]
MRYRVVCVGKPDGGPYGAAIRRDLARLDAVAAAELVVVRAGKGRDGAARRRQEGSGLVGALQGRSVALDERGRTFTTAALADHVAALDLRGESKLTLVVGGADGLDDAVGAACSEAWRLSDFTLAHELALAVLFEQLYRVESLRAGHPYHRGD